MFELHLPCLQVLRRPTPRGLVWCAANCAFAFFMFSYQVSGGLQGLPWMVGIRPSYRYTHVPKFSYQVDALFAHCQAPS